MALSFKFSTPVQFRTRLRQDFAISKGVRLHRLAAWADGNLTNVQLKNMFNLSDAQVLLFRTRLQNMRSRIEATDAEVE